MQGKNYGVKILDKVIETKSYVVFFRMDALWALLTREHFDLHQTRDANQHMQIDASKPATVDKELCAMPDPINLIVSSSNWHISSAECEAPSSARISKIALSLQRIACMSPELLDEN